MFKRRVAAAGVCLIALIGAACQRGQDTVGVEEIPAEETAVPEDVLTISLGESNGSGVSGTARLVPLEPGSTEVQVDLATSAEAVHPIHIHRGTCATLDPTPTYPLENVVGGRSSTVISVSIEALLSEPFAVNAHKSAAEVSVYVACGEIVRG